MEKKTNDELEQFRLNFSRCVNCDIMLPNVNSAKFYKILLQMVLQSSPKYQKVSCNCVERFLVVPLGSTSSTLPLLLLTLQQQLSSFTTTILSSKDAVKKLVYWINNIITLIQGWRTGNVPTIYLSSITISSMSAFLLNCPWKPLAIWIVPD